MKKVLRGKLWNREDITDRNEVPVEIELKQGCMFLKAKGYGDSLSEDNEGIPLMIEFYKGELRVVIWGDINQEDPSNIISLEGARNNVRK